MQSLSRPFNDLIHHYKVHILFFLVVLIISLTIAHPSIFVTDEWITINQLAQIQEGHQVIISEGKYGWTESGAISGDPAQNKFYLVYPLFLPIISLPALWLVNGLDRFFIVSVIYIWTFLLILFALFVNEYFPKYCRIGKYRWTSGIIIAAFVFFFANLYLNRPFSVTGNDAFPEILAIVLTNILLLCLMAVMIYEINRSIFPEPGFAVFGTLVCLSCSSYFFWVNYCKDHLFTAFLFIILTLDVVRFLKTRNIRHLAIAFFMAGLMAWARPELALFVFIFLCFFVLYVFFMIEKSQGSAIEPRKLLLTPFLTIIGAVPFFINNYLFTRNPFVPAWIFWKISVPSADTVVPGSIPVQIPSTDTPGSLFHLFVSSMNIHPETVLADVYGVLFTPMNGNLGVFPVVPLFLIAIFLLPVLWVFGKWQIVSEEKHLVVAITFLALSVFLTYLRGISGMNASVGMVPDMRYLSPLYLPLNLIGLLIIRKVPGIIGISSFMMRWMMYTCACLIPVSILLTVQFYPFPEIFAELFFLLNVFMILMTFTLIGLSLLSILFTIQYHKPVWYSGMLLAIVCSLPFIWQLNASFLVRMYGTGLGGYSFIVPVVRGILLIHFI